MNHALLAKVRKLLAKAEDPATTTAEAETYTAKAAELVAQYGIDQALLAGRDPSSDAVADRTVVLDAPYARDKASLLATVAVALRCQAVLRERQAADGKQISIHLFGFGADLERAELMFTSLLLQAGTQLARTTGPPWEGVAAFRRSWLAGFTAAVGDRLRTIERRAEERAADPSEETAEQRSSVALVLVDRAGRVEEAMNAAYPRLGTARQRSLSGSGGAAGWAAGKRADLGGSRFGAQASRRLSGASSRSHR
jgi:hypothetical protein